MLLRYYSVNSSLSQLRQRLRVHSHGLYTGEVGCFLLALGFSVSIVLMQPRLFTLADRERKPDGIRRLLIRFHADQRNGKRDREAAAHLVRFLDQGGTLSVRVPRAADIEDEILARRPLISSLTAHFLAGYRPAFTFHYQVITGFSNGIVHCNDPAWNSTGGQRSHQIEDYLFAIAATAYHLLDEPCLIKAKPNAEVRELEVNSSITLSR
jgi:hypothetical protein